MTRYHFNVHNGFGFLRDEEGRALPGLAAAREEGLKGARSIIADEVLQGRADLRGRLEIVDDDDRILMTIGFAEAVEVLLPAAGGGETTH